MGKDAPLYLVESIVQGIGRKALRVDRETGIIHGVKVLGSVSKNGRVYEPAALRDCATLYEGTPVHFGHLTKMYGDRCGTLKNCRATDKAVYGDWHLNKGHSLYEQVMHDAENSPSNLQLSHEVPRDDADIKFSEGVERVSRVRKVRSVAVVTEGATNSSLTEERTMNLDTLKAEHADLLEQYSKQVTSTLSETLSASQAELAKVQAELAESKSLLQESVDKLAVEEAAKVVTARKSAILEQAKELKAGELPEALIESFLKLSESEVKFILEDRAAHFVQATEKPESVSGAQPGKTHVRDVIPSIFRK